jgi:HK97 family phage portal protein
MAFWDRWFRTETKESRISRMIASMWGIGSPIYTPRNYEQLARVGFESNSIVYRAIVTIATACSGIPWVLYHQRRNSRKEIETDPLLDLLNAPNPRQGTADFIEALVCYVMLSGNAYVEAVRPSDTRPPMELYILRPDRMRVLPDAKNLIAGYEYNADGQRERFLAEEIMHLKLFAATHDWYGLSPIAVAARTVDQLNAANDWNTALLQNMARPPGALVTEASLDAISYERLKEDIDEKYSGSRNAGRPLLLENGLTWQSFGLNPVDMDWLEGKREAAREIAIALGVPPEIMGDARTKTYASYQEARKAFYQETVLPLMDKIKGRFNGWLCPMFNDRYVLDYDKDEIEALHEDRGAVWTSALQAVQAGILTVNEAREKMGYEALPGGDVLLLPSSQNVKDTDNLLPEPAPIVDATLAPDPMLPPPPEPGQKSASDPLLSAIQTQFAKEYDAIKDETDIDSIEAYLKTQIPIWDRLLKRAMRPLALQAAQDVLTDISSGKTRMTPIERAIDAMLDASTNAEEIVTTTIERVRSALTTKASSDPLRDLAKANVETRAPLIAETQTTLATNGGAYLAAQEVTKREKVGLVKIWLSRQDRRTRPAHKEAHNQRVPLEDPFIVGGEKLMHPMDLSLGATSDNVFGCRCLSRYEVAE